MPPSETLKLADRRRSEGRLLEAEALCRSVLETRPDLPDAEHLLGVIAHQAGKLSEAIEHVQRAVKLAPNAALYHANLGELLRLTGRPRLAVEAARRALAIDPAQHAALSNLGVALYELKDFEGAVEAQRNAIAARPKFVEAHNNLGNALYALHRFDEAIASYRRALELSPNFADAWANLGTTLHHSGDIDEAMFALRHAIALDPGHANAHSGLGILLLLRGDLGEGWDEYEWRLRSAERKGPRFPERPWEGESLVGKHIYVQAEQGLGDTIQFARYLPFLAERAGQVTLRVQQQLVTLMRESLSGITVLGDRGDAAPYQCEAALLSLPRLFRTRLETIPAAVPYLRVPTEAAERWRARMAPMAGVKVGVVWAGNREHVNDHRRSIDINELAPLFAVPGASFASLQVGARAGDLSKRSSATPTIDDLAPALVDFVESAAAVAALDLVVTVDTAVAHLAGALAKPVWVLQPWVSDWRWMHHREHSPWYPTMRLFRQAKGEEWAAVIARVASELDTVAAGNPAPLAPFKTQGERRAAQAAAIMAAAGAAKVKPAGPAEQPLTPGRAIILAEQKRRQGFLGDAEELCRRAISADPNNADAAHMLGIIAHQSGKHGEAIEHVRRAIALKPDAPLYHANLSEMCRLAGRVDEAIAAGRRALEIDPNNASALSNLGVALFDRGEFEEALSCYDRAIALQPDFVQAHSNRGNALQRLKRFAEAEPSYRRAIELRPDFSDAWNNLGTCLRELKRIEEAEEVYRKALELNPNNPDTLDNLALALKDLEQLDEAAVLLRRAIEIEPRKVSIFVHLASVLLDQDKVDEAAAAAERAVELDGNDADAVNLMGRVSFQRHNLQAAVGYYQRALALNPELADAYNNMGNVLKELGELQQAEDAYNNALRIDPEITGVYVNLADSKKFAEGDQHLAAMEALAAKTEGLSKADRMQLDFALGKAYADLKEYDRSFTHLLAANSAKRATLSYDENATLGLFDRIEAVFTAELVAAKSGIGEPSSLPIFVMGMPRSGTTLVEQIIASHPLVHGAGELKNFNNVVLMVRGPDGNPIRFPEFVPGLGATALRQIGARYVTSLRQLMPPASGEGKEAEKQWVTDKMPSNYYFAGLIYLALPNAIMIHTVRDPVDTCISCFSKLFSAEQTHTYELGELGRYQRRYQQLMEHWRRVLPAGRILDVRYEDVVADLEGEARRIIAHCGLPWDDRCLEFHTTNRPIRTASATQVRQPIYNTSVGRWRVYGEHLGPLLAALGVAPTQEPATG